ncbi:uncharacterized protein LOC129109021 [Anoplopoma fimbria]|uniref:uncharacterized protein LOC129109021 n=1 Tax=Anoplopoma fimbria TaxID=229290 RepID=UPI0023EB002B|nr:uncharacterized protein LOC129109021 [Anoplopoma fimbria]
MAVWDRKVLWSFMFLLSDVVSDRVNYPGPVCAVKGSTVTIPCTFTPLKSVSEGGREVSVEIVRVVWCQNHPICQGSTPTVYDSELLYNNINNPRYRYLGDKKGDCSLQITDVQEEDDETLRFRMEAHTSSGHFTGQAGVKVTVTDGTQMKIKNATDRPEAVTLNCTSGCSFHQLEVTWLRNGHALKHTGPSLYLGTPTAQDSGNYTCGLKNNNRTLSKPFSLYVEAEEEGGVPMSLIVGVVFGVLLALCTLILVLFIIRRKRAAEKSQSAERTEDGQEPADLYSDVQMGGGQRQEVREDEDTVSYAPIQFKQRSKARAEKEEDDSIIYSSVVGRS